MDDVSLPRWYHGPLGNEKRAESKLPHVKLDAESLAAWRAWQKAEREKQGRRKCTNTD